MNRRQRRAEAARNRKQMGYLQRLLAAESSLEALRGQVARAVIAHDACCAIYAGRDCTCKPEITIHSQHGSTALVIDDIGQVQKVRKH